jgi:hypothetical protein
MRRTVLLTAVLFALIFSAPSVYAEEQYLNELYRYTIVPPKGWTKLEMRVVKERDLAGFSLIDGTQAVATVTVTASSSFATVDSLVKAVLPILKTRYSGFSVVSERKVVLCGIDSYEMVWTANDGIMRRSIFVSRGAYDHFIVEYLSGSRLYDTYLSQAEQAINSFRLVEQITFSIEPRIGSITIDNKTYTSNDLPKSMWLEYKKTCFVKIEQIIPGATGTRYVFDAWDTGRKDLTMTITVDKSIHYVARYKTQFELKVRSSYGNPQGSGWYDQATTTTFSVTSPISQDGLMGALGAKYVMDRWTGDSTAQTPVASIMMDGPKTVIATWRDDPTQAYVVLIGIIAAVAIAAVVILKKGRDKEPKPQTSSVTGTD